ncbi:MAG: gamma-glutamylcyclotransferase family protein [Myxococcota bacterium]
MSPVAVFFYGSYLNRDVLADVELRPERWEPTRLAGYRLEIRPLANLVLDPTALAYGILAEADHAQLERLYTHAREVLGGVYWPHPVLVESLERPGFEPALCYIADALAPGPADPAYVERILGPARSYGFPEPYLAHIASFAPG